MISAQDLLKELMQRPKKEPRHHPCLFNFILYAKKEHIGSYLTSVVGRLSAAYPCRVIIIQEEESPETRFVPPSSDLYLLPIHPSQRENLPLLLFPLLKSDLPTYLLWAEDMLKNPFSLVGIENYLTKVIFDSSTCHDLTSFAKETIEYIKHSPYSFSDLNWNRIEQWQQLFAEQFNRQDKLSLIEKAETISIFHTSDIAIQAIYLQAWISLKLDWNLLSFEQEGNSIDIEYEAKGRKVHVAITGNHPSTLSDGRILAVHIESTDHSHMKFSRDPEMPHVVTIEQEFPHYCEMPITYFFDEERFGRSLSLEVGRRSTQESLYLVLCEIARYPETILCH